MKTGIEPAVVVIEDDPDIRSLVREILESERYRVAEFATPDLARIRGGPWPLAFVIDLMLPGMSGVAVAQELRPHYPHTPFIAMSASRIMLERAERAGVFEEIVPKPFNLATLLDALDRRIARRAS